MRNVIGTLPASLTAAASGIPKYTFCIAEERDDSPWPPPIRRALSPTERRDDLRAYATPQISNG